MTYVCLDSWAQLAWLKGHEPATKLVSEAYRRGRPVVSWINACEVYYLIEREHGEKNAVDVINTMRSATDLELPTERRILEAARLKARNAIALADCFAISCAADNDAILYTGDPEILGLKDLPCEVRDLRG